MIKKGKEISDKALNYIKQNKKVLVKNFCSIEKFPSHAKPYTIFMAGSPGAGKTEYSKAFINELYMKDSTVTVRIDPDEIRNFIPWSTDYDIEYYKSAVNKGQEILFDYVQHHNQNVLVDGTLANLDHSRKLIDRALGKRRKVSILYTYQDPVLAWDFTKKRKVIENRSIPKSVFVTSFFDAINNVNILKREFNGNIDLTVIIKNYSNGVEKIHFNVASVDPYIKMKYTMGSLEKEII